MQKIVGVVIALLLLTLNMEASVGYINVTKIAKIESNFNSKAVNPREGSRGICQVRIKGALADWNMHHKDEQHTPDELFNSEINMKIADWYLNTRIPQMIRRFNKPVTAENILISYNAGIKYVAENIHPPKSTIRYINRYNALGADIEVSK